MPNVLIDIRPTQNVHRKSGIGRYAKNLISRLPRLDPENSYHFLHYDGAGLPELPDVVGQKVAFLPFPKSKPRIGDGKIWGRVAREHRIESASAVSRISGPFRVPGEASASMISAPQHRLPRRLEATAGALPQTPGFIHRCRQSSRQRRRRYSRSPE